MSEQYRCIVCQNVFPSVEQWREHARSTYGERVFEQAGFTVDPQPEPVIDSSDPFHVSSIVRGLREVIAGRYTGYHNDSFSIDVVMAMYALLVKDGDPYWMMSDAYGVSPKAELTQEGRAFARKHGMLVWCADHLEDSDDGCNREVLSPEFGGKDALCSTCRASLAQFGPPPQHDAIPQMHCGFHHVHAMRMRVDPNYSLPTRTRYYGRQYR